MLKHFLPEITLALDDDLLYDIKLQMGSKKMRNPVFIDEIKVNQEGFEFMYTVGLQLLVKDKRSSDPWITVKEGYMVFNTIITLDITDTSILYNQKINLRDVKVVHNGEEQELDKDFLTNLFNF